MLIDSNIIIYASKPGYEFLHSLMGQADLAVSVISYVETLGYHQLTEPERKAVPDRVLRKREPVPTLRSRAPERVSPGKRQTRLAGR
jgi:hypothetical protein